MAWFGDITGDSPLGGVWPILGRSCGHLGVLLEPLGTVLGAPNHSAGPIHRDFGASWGHLAALLTPSLILIFFQDVFVLLFEPFGVDVELPR